jgi:hypothetical protein
MLSHCFEGMVLCNSKCAIMMVVVITFDKIQQIVICIVWFGCVSKTSVLLCNSRSIGHVGEYLSWNSYLLSLMPRSRATMSHVI